MSLHQKRSAYKAQLDNAESIGAGQTIVPALIKSIKSGTTSKGNQYFRISAICLAREDTFIKMRPPKKEDKKQKVDDASAAPASVESSTEIGELPKGTTIRPGEQFMSTAYDSTAADLEQGNIVKLALTTDWYIDHFTFQTSKVMVDEKYRDVLNRKVYDACVVGTTLAEIPTKDNFSPDDFPMDTDEKFITRSFILPLSIGVGTQMFTNVEIQLDPHDKDRFVARIRDDPTKYVGINADVGGDSPVNMLKAVYTLNNGKNTKVLMTMAYSPKAKTATNLNSNPWDCFGVMNLSEWQNTGGRYIFYAVDWLVYGYSQHNKIMAIKANMKGGDDMFAMEDDSYGGYGDNNVEESDDGENPDTEEFKYSTGFITKMSVNMKDTVKACGIPLSFDYINRHFGPESGYENDHEYTSHPFNGGWKTAMKRNKSFFVTFSDLSSDQRISFIKEYEKIDKDKNEVQFYGVYSVDSDEPYEIQAETNEERETLLEQKGYAPVMIYALNK